MIAFEYCRRLGALMAIAMAVGTAFLAAQPAKALATVLHSLIDDNGKQIVPREFRYIKYIGHGLYLMRRMVSVVPQPADSPGPNQIIDRDGKVMSLILPPGAILYDAVLFEADGATHEKWHALPDNTVLIVIRDGAFGLADVKGNYIVPPQYTSISHDGGTSFSLSTKDPYDTHFNVSIAGCAKAVTALDDKNSGNNLIKLKDTKLMASGAGVVALLQLPEPYGYTDKQCIIVSQNGSNKARVKALHLAPTESDRLIQTNMDLRFLPHVWARCPAERKIQFGNFLQEHALIGMTRAKVEEYLGQPNFETCYGTSIGFNGVCGEWIELKYDKDKVTGWRWGHLADYRQTVVGPWVITDVMYEYITSYRIGAEIKMDLVPRVRQSARD